MSVILEFTIQSEEFSLGAILSGVSGMHLEIERIVPTGGEVLPFVWATGDTHEEFEEAVRNSPIVTEFLALDKIGDSGLYRIKWEEPQRDLVDGIAESEATVLEAEGEENWLFRLRFNDHDALSQFHNYCTEQDITIHIERTYTLSERVGQRRQFGLSQDQREALVLALRRGYFATPSESNLSELATELDISRQALSTRIRRGNETVLRTALLSSVTDFD
ncbi:bacterio-opsin activator domain-containing protein [Natrinema caseinilyticum]|uniref:bacterio-opsin activator domain-containing protein n=1 Tax=Natrinema caseinilyticum TaxID=2961570 RepID=UPI0020C3AB20|nr:helix-turn-helix domain-containing protein [Natrinema caseinilyticum]